MTLTKKQTGSFSTFDQTKIYFESRGSGQPIVFVYGLACLMNHWHHQTKYFSKSYETITLDIRGHHKSAVPQDSKNLTLQAAGLDLKFLLEHLHLKDAHFVGHSFGVPVLLSAYRQNPEMFRSLTLVNGFSKNPIQGMFGLDVVEPLFHMIKKQFDANPEMWNQLWKLSINNPLSMWMSGILGGFNLKLTQFKDIEIYAKGVSQIPLEVFIPLFEDMMGFNGDQILEEITAPTLIVSGDKDMVTPLRFQEEMRSKIKNNDYVVIPYGSHCTQLDFPDYFNLRLEKFLQTVDAKMGQRS